MMHQHQHGWGATLGTRVTTAPVLWGPDALFVAIARAEAISLDTGQPIEYVVDYAGYVVLDRPYHAAFSLTMGGLISMGLN